MVGKPGEDGADRTIILHGRHVVVDLIRGYFAFCIDGNLNIRERSRRLAWTTAYRRRASTARAQACRPPATGAPPRLPRRRCRRSIGRSGRVRDTNARSHDRALCASIIAISPRSACGF